MFYTSLPLEGLTANQCDGNIIQEHLLRINTGDVLLMNRNCFSMKDAVGKGFCLLSKLGSRFDHAGLLIKMNDQEVKKYLTSTEKMPSTSPSNTYVLEANVKGVTIYPLEDRVGRTSAHEVAFSSLQLNEGGEMKRQKILSQLPVAAQCPYSNDIHSILPCIFSPPDKLDRLQASGIVKILDGEIYHLLEWASRQDNPSMVEGVKQICKLYEDAQQDLLHLYFPFHIKQEGTRSGLSTGNVDWSQSAFAVDGVNHAEKMVCSELICNMWLNAGITTGYLPASSQRPFDFYLSPLRFNFSNPSDKLVNLVPLKVTKFFSSYWNSPKAHHDSNATVFSSSNINSPLPSLYMPSNGKTESRSSSSLWEEERMAFFRKAYGKQYSTLSSFEEAIRQIALDSRSGVIDGVAQEFLAQSTPAFQLQELPFRYFCSVALISSAQFACAPWTLRSMEAQAGQFAVRGGMWSLASGVLLRHMIAAAVQSGVMAGFFSHYCSTTQRGIVLQNPLVHGTLQTWVDTRNPFYSMVAAVWISSLLSWMLTIPMRNANFYWHFVRRLPGPIPFRYYYCGAFSFLPFVMILPFPGFWLTWYETVGSFVFPMRSSVWRPHDEMMREQKQANWHSKAILSALVATLGLDALMYCVDTYLKRRSLQRVSTHMGRHRCFGSRHLFAGFRYRFYSTSVQFSVSAFALSKLGLI